MNELERRWDLYVMSNDCCGGHDGMRVIDDTHTVTWSSGECGGTKPTPQDSRWMPVDASDADAAEVVDDEASMHNFYWRLVESQWIEDAP